MIVKCEENAGHALKFFFSGALRLELNAFTAHLFSSSTKKKKKKIVSKHIVNVLYTN